MAGGYEATLLISKRFKNSAPRPDDSSRFQIQICLFGFKATRPLANRVQYITYTIIKMAEAGARINKHIRPESVLNLKSREISFFHKSFHSCPITLRFCTEYGSYTAVICAKYRSDWTTIGDYVEERDFARFQFKTASDRLGFIDTGPCTYQHFICRCSVAYRRQIISRHFVDYTKITTFHACTPLLS